VAAAFVGVVSNRLGHTALMEHKARVMADVQTMALQTLLRRSVGFHNNNIGGKLVSDAIDYPNAFSQVSDAVFVTLLPLALILAIGAVLISLESWTLGAVIVCMTALVVGLGVRDSRRFKPFRLKRLAAAKAVTSHLADTITNIQTVKTFAREPDELAAHCERNERLMDVRISDWHQMSTRGNTRMMLLLLFQAAFVLLTIHLVRRNPALLGIGIFAFTFTITLSNRLFDVNLMIRTIEDGLLQASPMTEIILESPEIKDVPRAKKLTAKRGAVAFADVTFGYNDAANGQTVFSHLQLAIKPGERVGLVGPSGGGKSTLTRLLLRFEDINDGGIFIDDQNIAEVTQTSLRQAISYVPQEPLLFHRSVRENIAYGNPNASDKAIVRAAKAAHADEFIRSLSSGYDTIVGERGVKLSGGQRQRVAIARAILKDAPILVLDEATSALDSENEALIQDALWKLMQGRTTMVIAHRLSTIQKMDRIVVLEHGAIVEQGSHAELLKRKGAYAKLWARQSGGFMEE